MQLIGTGTITSQEGKKAHVRYTVNEYQHKATASTFSGLHSINTTIDRQGQVNPIYDEDYMVLIEFHNDGTAITLDMEDHKIHLDIIISNIRSSRSGTSFQIKGTDDIRPYEENEE